MYNKNLIILTFSQIFSFTAAAITVFLSGIIGSSMTDEKSLVTIPAALMIVGTAAGSIFASYTMSKQGRRFGFMLGALITSLAALISAYAVFTNLFLIYCFSNFLIGIGTSFAAQYRFAAAESVSKNQIPKAVSMILFASILGALIGPNLATATKEFISNSVYSGSYIFLSIITILPLFFFLFYKNENTISSTKKITNKGRTYFQLFSQPLYIQAVVSSGLAYCTMSFLMTATPISMHIHNNISLGKTGMVIMFHIIAMFLPSLITGNIIKKFGHNKTMYAGVFFLFISIMSNFIDQSFFNYLIGLMLLGVGWNFLFISGTSLLIISYTQEEKYRAQGLNDFIVFSTQAVGALSAGILLSIFGWKMINIFCLPILAIIVITVYLSNKKQKFIN